jgi:MFS transporter, DHA2 family, methylenomycin A resistance protein
MPFAGDRRTKTLTLGAMCFALFMAMLDNTVVNVALPSIQHHLGSGVSGLQWIVDAYTLLFASLMLTGGTLGDIYGRKRTFLVGLLVFSAGSALCGLAPGIGVLIAGRAIQGVGAASLIPSTLSILTNTFPDPRERAQAIGIWAGVSGLALALGPVLGGFLVDALGWQSVFFLNVPVGIIAFVVASRVVQESKHPEGRQVDLPGQLLGVIALGSLTYALIEGNAIGWRSPVIGSLLAVALVAAVAFLLVERASRSPMLMLQFFRNPTFSAAVTVAYLVSFGMFSIFFFLSLFFQNVQGDSAVATGVRFLPQTLAIIVTAPLAGRLAGRIGSRAPMAIGLAMVGSGLLLLLRADAATPYSHLWWNFTMMGIGMGLTMTPMTAAVMGSVPAARAGMASAVTNTSREIGGVFGIALLGAIVTGRLTSVLDGRLAGLGVAARLRAPIVAAATHGGAIRRLPGVDPAVLHQAIGDSYVSGMHVALVLAGVALLFGSALAVVFVRRLRDLPTEVVPGEGESLAMAVA